MANGENSVERAHRMVADLNQEIEFLRGCELDAKEQLKKAMNDLEEIRDRKMDALFTKLALLKFIDDGGGLDMFEFDD